MSTPQNGGPFSDPNQPRLYATSESPSLSIFKTICSQQATKAQYPLATSIQNSVPIYTLPPYSTLTPETKTQLQDEWYAILLHGPGVFVTQNLYSDRVLLNNVNTVFHNIIAKEKETMTSHGDHFAGAGKNDRIWNSFSKHALADPCSFQKYYSNPYLGLIASSWLGPGYRITAQVNNVKPGAAAQVAHRDYHLGFMSAAACSNIPRAMQVASQCLTLQGAVAHVDVPVESGPTRLLPFSQTFAEGYMAYRLPEFSDYFLKNHVALPLEQGDGLFFNPALFHAAGTNRSEHINRLANLLQISSAFGKPMESVDAIPLVGVIWDELSQTFQSHGATDAVKALVEAVGEGYTFPTNLDRNPPRSDDMAPKSEQDVMWECLQKGYSKDDALRALQAYREATAA